MIRWLPFLVVPLVAWIKDATVIVLAFAALLVLADGGLRRAALAPARLAPAVLAFALLAIWSLISFAWAPVLPATNWVKAAIAIGLIAILGRGADTAPPPIRPMLVAWIALFVVLLIERATGGYFLGLVRASEPELRRFDTLSPGLAFLTCLTFPVAYLVWKKYARLWAPLAVVFACFALGVTYRMDAAPIAILAGGIAFLCVWIAGRFGFVAVAGALALVAMAWGPLATLAWSNDLPAWLTQHFTHNWGLRVEIWHQVDTLIHARPVLGYGFDSTRVIGQSYGIPIHTHNGLLQIWLELGVIGVALFLGWSALALLALYRRAADRTALATGLATVLAVSVFWEVSFGIWQGWWLAAVGLTFVALRVGLRA